MDKQTEEMRYQCQLEFYLKQAKEREDTRLRIIDMKREMKYQLIDIRELLTTNVGQKALEYIDNLLKTKADEPAKSGNVMIDSLVNDKYQRAKQLNIRFYVDILVPLQLPYHEGDLLIILANVMDYGLTVAQKVKNKERFFSLAVGMRGNVLSIIVNHSDDGNYQRDNKAYDNWFDRVKKAVEKYHGVIDVETSDDKFTLSIILFGENCLVYQMKENVNG